MRNDSNSRDFCLNNELFITIDRAYSLSSIVALIEKGANPDTINYDGDGDLLIQTAIKRMKSTVPCLLDNGASVNILNKHGTSPLLTALQESQRDIAGDLVSRGARVISNESLGNGELHFAVYRNYHELIIPLVKNTISENPDFNILEQDNNVNKNTPLDLARKKKHNICFNLLEMLVNQKSLNDSLETEGTSLPAPKPRPRF